MDWIQAEIASAEREPGGPFADAGFALQRLLSAGSAREDIGRVARSVAYSVVFDLLYHIDYGRDQDLSDDYPGWALMETEALDGEEPTLTGRDVGGLHEDILSMDPSGREGRPPPAPDEPRPPQG